MKRTHNTRIIDFQKELEIARISQILRTWPLFRVQIVLAAVQARESNQNKVACLPCYLI